MGDDGDLALTEQLAPTVAMRAEAGQELELEVVHGSYDVPGARLRVAAEHAGVNSNVLSDDRAIDPLSGTSVLNGIPVEVVATG